LRTRTTLLGNLKRWIRLRPGLGMDRRGLVIILLAAVAVAEAVAIFSLYIELEQYRRTDIDLKVSETYIPVKDAEDIHHVRLTLINLGTRELKKLNITLIWINNDQPIHRETITIHNIKPRTLYQYTYQFTFEGPAQKLIYIYQQKTQTAQHAQ